MINTEAPTLLRYRPLIASLPVQDQAAIPRWSTWSKHALDGTSVAEQLTELFRPGVAADRSRIEISISRRDLINLGRRRRLDAFAVAVLLWGYPNGLRGKSLPSIKHGFPDLIRTLDETRSGLLHSWSEHKSRLRTLRGVGISTYTKYLCFLGAELGGHPALILDDQVARAASASPFREFAELEGLKWENSEERYPLYLSVMHAVARQLKVRAENLELFLFLFGRGLKLPNGHPRFGAQSD